ncbi:hypothetical protein GCM10023175_24130 [Pseudonocardia xishanensis]|uniref:Uncharacterized protein n=1 Tax=Pseudonocardia xishanensis TaxID=630995 RepID=A0ABP8RQF6_9PSEU
MAELITLSEPDQERCVREGPDDRLGLDPGEGLSGAGVGAVAEGEMVDRVAGHVETVRLSKTTLVAVARPVQQQDLGTGCDADTVDLDVGGRHAPEALDGRVVAEHLVESARHAAGIPGDEVPLVRVGAEQVDRVRDGVDGLVRW